MILADQFAMLSKEYTIKKNKNLWNGISVYGIPKYPERKLRTFKIVYLYKNLTFFFFFCCGITKEVESVSPRYEG